MDIKHRCGRLVWALATPLALSACNFIEPTDLNPNAVPEATVDQLFTGIQVNSFYLTESQIARIASIWTQQMAGTDRQFAILDTYVLTEEDADGEFTSLYIGGGLVDLRKAIALAEEEGRMPYAGILKIYEAYVFGTAASIFGDVPFSEAAMPDITAPALDPQAQVYAGVQDLLDQAIADLAGTGDGPGDVDMSFGGDVARWTAVAHTLKARFYLHWAEVDGAPAYQQALTEAAMGIASVDGTWKTRHSTAATENNLWFQFMRDRSGYISSGDYLVPAMVADGDPRLPIYFSPASGGGFVSRDSRLSATGFGAPAFDVPIVSCAENAFIEAEAQFGLGNEGPAQTAAQAALACQEDEYGVDLSAIAADIGSRSGSSLFDRIMGQKYVAMFLNIEAYNDYKRTCRPAIVQRSGGMPGRLFYGQQERQTNPNIMAPAQQPSRNANDPAPC